MEDVRVIEIKQSVFANNDAQAQALRQELRQKQVFLLNLMSVSYTHLTLPTIA